MSKRLSGLGVASLSAIALGLGLGRMFLGAPAKGELPPSQESKATAWTTAVDPKPLSAGVKKGLAWLAEHQHPDGGWSQGEESANMGNSGDPFRDRPDVADTCIAALALIRSGSTPREGPYKDAVARAVRFVRSKVEASDAKSLSVTDVQGTRVQMKLGPNIDTFLASLLLAEVKGKMPDAPGNKGVDVALNKVIDKIKTNQKADGTWDNRTGWAPVLAQGIGGKGLNRAAQAGAMVSSEVLAKAENFAINQANAQAVGAPAAAVSRSARIDVSRAARPVAAAAVGAPAAGAGSAGVELYDRAASIGVLQDSVNSLAAVEKDLRKKAEAPRDESERKAITRGLERIENTKRVNSEAKQALLGRLDDAAFVAGFGSNGGEEFLSYMNISESLVVKGGLDWTRWDDAMTGNLGRVQNDDGSWSGHHCITGRTFCTSAALLVLMADRTPVPVKDKDKEQGKGKGEKAAAR